MTPSHNERLIPSTLGKYEIIQRLAVGGMAELFLARVSGLEGFEKYVVVKRILPRYAQDKNFVDMFLDEARLAARLDHQNIVQVHDIGREDEAYFFAMQYLHGEDMQGIMKRMAHDGQILPLDKALTVISGVAAGLQYAHEKRDTDGLPLHIVHRDVAPSNILVTYEGGVKLVDFGIARAHFRRSQTEHGRVKGKLSYMSPEQCRGEELDGRSDIFALGIVMYELTTTSRLFPSRGGKKLAVMERIVNGDVPAPSSRIADYPPELEEILMRALRVSRAERYQRAGELLDDIELFAKNRSMSLSASSLAQWLRKTIGHRPEPWRVDRPAAPARDTGKVRRDDDDDERVMTEPKPKLSSDSDERRTTFKYNATPDRVAPAVKYTAIPEHSAPAVKHTATPEYTEPVTPAHLAAEDMQRVVAMRQQKSRRGTIALGLAVLAVVALIFTALHMGGSGTVPDSAANGHGVKASSEGDGTQPTSTDAAEATQGKARSDEASQNQRKARSEQGGNSYNQRQNEGADTKRPEAISAPVDSAKTERIDAASGAGSDADRQESRSEADNTAASSSRDKKTETRPNKSSSRRESKKRNERQRAKKARSDKEARGGKDNKEAKADKRGKTAAAQSERNKGEDSKKPDTDKREGSARDSSDKDGDQPRERGKPWDPNNPFPPSSGQ